MRAADEELGGAARLRTIIYIDVASTVAATVFMVIVYATAVRSGYLLLAAALVAVAGLAMAAGLRPLGRGDARVAMRWLAGANWGIAVVAAAIATFSWPVLMLTALIPSLAAATLIPRRELAGYVAVSVAVSVGVVLVGVLQDFSGLTDEVPEAIQQAVLLVFAPTLVGLLALMVLLNSLIMQRALAAVNASRAQLGAQAEELRRSRARLVAATDGERRRIERDLHDGAQQRLIGINIALSRTKDLCRSDPVRAARHLDVLRHELRVAHEELRNLAQGVYPPVLTEHGLEAALQSAADRCPVPVTVALGGVGRHRANIEAALYFCCVEALQNAVKHSEASSIRLACGRDGTELWVSVSDDGVGFEVATARGGSGIVNIGDRLGAIGGVLEVTAAPGGGTIVRGAVDVDGAEPRR